MDFTSIAANINVCFYFQRLNFIPVILYSQNIFCCFSIYNVEHVKGKGAAKWLNHPPFTSNIMSSILNVTRTQSSSEKSTSERCAESR